MALLLTDVTEILKTQYLPGMQNTIQAEGTVTGLIESRGQKETNVAYDFEKKFRIGLSEGGGMRAYDAALPTAGQTKWATFQGTCKHYYHVIKLYKGVIDLMRTNKQAFVDAISAEMDGAADAIKLNLERMNFGDGGVTPLAIANACTNSDQVMCLTVDDTRFLRPGMLVDLLESAHTEITNGTSLEIASVDVDNNKVYITAVATGGDLTTLVAAAADAYIYAEDGYTNEFDGFGILVRDLTSTVLGINRTTASNAWARPHVWKKKSSGAGIEIGAATGTNYDWEIADIRRPVRDLMTRWHADKSGLLGFATTELMEYYANLWAAEGGYHETKAKVDGWPYDSYAISGVPIIEAMFAGKNKLDVVYMPDVVTFENAPLGWEDMDGNMWKWVANYDAYTAYMSLRKQLGHYSPYKCASIGDLKDIED
jgi:hypothetical protein